MGNIEGLAMRFFFDFTSKEKVIFDYLGLEFNNSRGAIDFAQEKSQLLKNSLSQEWAGWSIEVCSPEGAKLCVLRIGNADAGCVRELQQGRMH